MAEVDPRIPQVVDPELTVDLTRLLQIRGPLGVLNVLDTIVPVVSLGNVVTPDINIRGPVFRSTDVFGARFIAPAVNTILADSGALPPGTYDLMTLLQSQQGAGQNTQVQLQHRNAANAANLMILDFNVGADNIVNGFERLVLSYELSINERIRITNITAGAAGTVLSAFIFIRLR